jgi:DNA-binding transcriptional MerR regulator
VADTPIDIPNRAAFKASEVCEIAQIPPYVLRSWEKEFPGLGAAGRPGGPRIYRREDVEQILRIKELVFAEGLTLAGARRKIEGDAPVEELPLVLPAGVPDAVRAGVAEARQGLRDLLTLLSGSAGTADGQAAPGAAAPAHVGEADQDAPTWPPKKARGHGAPASAGKVEQQEDLPLLEAPAEPAPKSRRGGGATRK